jgi:putative ABC transport system permease protein
MPDWRAEVRSRLAALALSPSRIDAIADEVAEHLEDRYHEQVAAGRSPADAEAAAWREFETPHALAREVARTEHPGLSDLAVNVTRGHRVMDKLGSDLRSSLRTLRGIRGASALAVLAFALGIGITTAVFSVFYGVLLKPLPYPDADRMVRVFDVQPACGTCPASYTKFVDWRSRNNVFESMAGVSNAGGVITGLGDAERVVAARTSFTVPAVFRTQPMIGRWFTEDEDAPGGNRVVLLGNQYWIDRFASDRNVLGRGITIDGQPYQIIGVMPPEFMKTTALFRPLQMAPNPAQRGSHFLPVYARLKPGVTVAQAQKEMVALGVTLATEFGHNHGIDVQSYPWLVLGNITQPLRLLMGAVSFVLLIACANIANLLLASGAARRREVALRAAIGATRWDLTRQLLVESVTLALIGGLLGLLLAQAAIRVFASLADQIVPRATSIALDTNVLLFAAALSVVTGIFCALWPMMRLDVRALAAATREGDQRSGGGDRASRRFGHGLVVAEIAIAFSLLAGSGLLLKNLMRLEARDTGFSADHAVAFDLPTAGPKYATADALRGFYDALIPQLAAVPRVQDAAATSLLPMYTFGNNGEVSIEGGNPWPANAAPLVERAQITPDYFNALAIRMVKGRPFDERDRVGGEPVAILSQGTAEKFWPGQDPIGRRFQGSGQPNPTAPWITVVGVVADVRSFGLERSVPFQAYFPLSQQPNGSLTIVLRVAGDDPAGVLPDVRRIVKAIDPSMPVVKVQTIASVVSTGVGLPRLISVLTSVFGALAGLLAAVGVYGVMAYNVRRDRRQFAIRLALGADPARVRQLILLRGVMLGAAGVAIGALGAMWLTRFVKSLLSDVAPTDPWVFTAAALTLFAVAVAACAWPAFQASRTDPMGALRGD